METQDFAGKERSVIHIVLKSKLEGKEQDEAIKKMEEELTERFWDWVEVW